MPYADIEMKRVFKNAHLFLLVYFFAYSLLSVPLDLVMHTSPCTTNCWEVLQNEVERGGVLPLNIQREMKARNENLSCHRPLCRNNSSF